MEQYLAVNGSPFKGRSHTEEAKQRNREKHLGKKASEETKAKMKAAKVGIVLKQYTCTYCGKEGKGSAMFRYHFKNCKYKKDE